MQQLLREYLRKYQYQSADTEVFLEVLQEVSGEDKMPVKFLKNWLNTGSQPILFIGFNSTSREFIFEQTGKLPAADKHRWWIPIWVECLAGTRKESFFWIPPHEVLKVKIEEFTQLDDTVAVAFNRNYPVYYEISYNY